MISSTCLHQYFHVSRSPPYTCSNGSLAIQDTWLSDNCLFTFPSRLFSLSLSLMNWGDELFLRTVDHSHQPLFDTHRLCTFWINSLSKSKQNRISFGRIEWNLTLILDFKESTLIASGSNYRLISIYLKNSRKSNFLRLPKESIWCGWKLFESPNH